ncbi:hypothetical protein E4U21_000255 [Claviceps maximensis]|nr:hypothetical protein E4U21_000255 [Claviceps maximensis]
MNMSPQPGQTEPLAGRFVAIIVSLLSTTALTMFLTQRYLAIRCWNRVPMVIWFVFAIYVDSYIFVIASALLQNTLGVNHNMKTCDSAILICLICYVTTKVGLLLSDSFDVSKWLILASQIVSLSSIDQTSFGASFQQLS